MLTTLSRRSIAAAVHCPPSLPRVVAPAVRRCVSVDELEQAIQNYGARLLAVARRHLDCEADCADAVQEAYLKALRGLPRFRGECDLGTWLHRIVVNVCLMKRRAASIRRTASLADSDVAMIESPNEQRRWDDRTLTAARDAMRRLSESHQTVIQLRFFEGFNTAETAALLGVNTAVVKTRLHRACRALRRALRLELASEA
ncbi:MAG: sigma-70 family RNA polymerase sigma factor [Planctomycetaceae bacterium]